MKKIFLISLALMISACSTINLQDTGPRLAIQYATAKFIEQSTSPAFRALEIISEAERVSTFIDMQGVPLSEIKQRLIERVADRGLSIADTLLATELINVVDIELKEDISTGVIGDDEKIRINAFLALIKQVALIYNDPISNAL